jgi:DNA/RNA-binding domain of Phe-tRNA-synthetase-like protein
MSLTIVIEPHTLLELGAFATRFSTPLAAVEASDTIRSLCVGSSGAPLTCSDQVRGAVRELLRVGGFKPAGRNKPASEYLAGAAAEGRFPQINTAVDACNAVSLHAGLPISLLDIDRLVAPLSIQVAPVGTTYAFNPSGQVIDASGLLCLFDAEGASGTPVKDAQRTKTHDDTRTTLSIVWGTKALAGRTGETTRWYRELVAAIPGATVEDVTLA